MIWKLKINRVLLPYCILIIFSSCSKKENSAPSISNEISYSFLVAGHVYGDPLAISIGFYPPFKAQFSYIQEFPKLIHAIYTGDVVRNNLNEVQWDSAITDMQTLGIDYHVSAGNHDRGEVFLDRFGSYYYSFIEGSDLFIILNSDNWKIEGEQKDFLESSLTSIENVSNIFLFCHELIWWSPDSIFQNIGVNYAPHYPGSTNYWAEIDPILQNTNKPVYLFSGDVGATEPASPFAYYKYSNVRLVASGMGRAIDSNYLIVDVYTNGEVKINLKATEGEADRLGDITLYEIP